MIEGLLDSFGEGRVLAGAGLLVGSVFGATAQHARFCLRAASVEVAQGQFGPRLYIWLIAFGAAVFSVQILVVMGWLDLSGARQIAQPGSLSGAMIGGLLFGCGMILARGCASRLLVLSATGNLRALVTGLIVTLVAQASLRGVLSPLREGLSGLWLVPGGAARDLQAVLGLTPALVALVSGVAILLVLLLAWRRGVAHSRAIAALGVGFAIGLGWLLTYSIAQASFEVVAISSVTFTGPSADTLMGLIDKTDLPLSFGVGLVPGVFAGSACMALFAWEFRVERFDRETPMERYLIGAPLMGFGGMLAGGCAVGAGMTGGAIFALTAWVAVFFMWLGAMATHLLLVRAVGRHSALA